MHGQGIRVGELAKRTGVTVRTLHHWDQVALLKPTGRTHSGHRLYGSEEIRQLQRIRSLRALGLSLDQISSFLTENAPSLEVLLNSQREQVRNQLSLLRDLESQLDRVLEVIADGGTLSEEDLLRTMEMMTMIEKHFSPEQLEALKKREEALGPEAIQSAQEEWPRLIASVREEMEKGTDPRSEAVQALAKRWGALIQAFSGGDSQIETSLAGMYQAEPDVAASQGLDPALFQYIGAALRPGGEEGTP